MRNNTHTHTELFIPYLNDASYWLTGLWVFWRVRQQCLSVCNNITLCPIAITGEPSVMSCLERRIAEVEYSPPTRSLLGNSGVIAKVPFAFDGLIKQPIREPRRVDRTLAVAICSLIATGCVSASLCQVPLRTMWPSNGGSTVSINNTGYSEVVLLGCCFDTVANFRSDNDAV